MIAVIDRLAADFPIVGFKKQEIKFSGNKTPMAFYSIEANSSLCRQNVMFYGHLDKFQETGKWGYRGPNQAHLEEDKANQRQGDRLYGRGLSSGAYAVYCVMLAIKNLQE